MKSITKRFWTHTVFVLSLLTVSQAYASNTLFFSSSTHIPGTGMGGAPLTENAQYLSPSVIPNTDFVLTIGPSIGGANFNNTDGIGVGGTGGDDLLVSVRAIANPGGFRKYSLNFIEAGSILSPTPAIFANLNLTAYNITGDFNSGLDDFSTMLILPKSEVAGMPTPRNSNLVEVIDCATMMCNSMEFMGMDVWEISLANNNTIADDEVEDLLGNGDFAVDFSYQNVSEIMFYWGIDGSLPTSVIDPDGNDRNLLLTGDGVLIPIPPAVWLFASALAFFGLIGRRKLI